MPIILWKNPTHNNSSSKHLVYLNVYINVFIVKFIFVFNLILLYAFTFSVLKTDLLLQEKV